MERDIYLIIEELWRKELVNNELQPIPSNFYKRAREIIMLINNSLSKESDKITKSVLEEEVRIIRALLENLIKLRLYKILSRSLIEGRIDEEKLTPEELEVYKSIRARINTLLATTLSLPSEIKAEEDISTSIPKEEYLAIRFLKSCPEFVGIDNNVYGPFDTEDIALIPKDNAEALISRGIAVKIAIGKHRTEG